MHRPAFAVEPLEDFNESVALNEFTLNDFRMDLSRYIEANRQKLLDARLRFYAVVPKNAEHTVIKPVAIYCLKQRADARENEAVNALQPYFLVYIRDFGELHYNFTAPKQILEIFRTVCLGKTEAYAALCKLFDEETNHGEDMSRYGDLLDRAVAAIGSQFARKNAANLFAGRAGKFASESSAIKGATDFALVTWRVIK